MSFLTFSQELATAASLLGALHRLGHAGANGLVEDCPQTRLSESRSLHVLGSTNLLGDLETIVVADGSLLLVGEALEGLTLLAEVDLGAHEDDGRGGAVVGDLGVPLGADILEGGGVDDGEAEEEDVGLGVGERAEAIEVLLSGSVPEVEVPGLAIDHHVGVEVVEYRGVVVAGEGVLGVRDEEAGLAKEGKREKGTTG